MANPIFNGNVTSYNQSGGITANQVILEKPLPRSINQDDKGFLLNKINEGKELHVSAILGDNEAFQLAVQMVNFYKDNNGKANISTFMQGGFNPSIRIQEHQDNICIYIGSQ